MTIPLEVLAVLLLVLGNGFFVAAEYALVTARRARLMELAHQGNLRARIALRIMDSPVRFIGTVQLGITAFSIALGAVGEPLVEHWIDEPVLSQTLAFVLAFALVTYLHVVLASYPVVWFLQASANAVTRLFGIEPAPAGVVAHSEEDLRLIVAQAGESGVVEEAEEELLYKVFDFADKEVHEVMVTRPQVVAISVDLPAEECLAAVIDSPYTRYPAYRGSLDQIVGILHVRDLFSALYGKGIENVVMEELLRQPYLVPETKDLGALLAEFRQTKQHMAIVVDEYGAMEGIVTLEDLLEEIVGEIADEYDLPDESLQRIDEKTVRVSGTFPIDDFNETFEQEMPHEDYHTLAGFVFGELGRAPEPGDEIEWNGLRFKVVDVDGARIEKLDVEFLSDGQADAAEVEQ